MKGNMLLGMARGSVGDVTFYRFEGQQAGRARNRKPSNPRTDSQLISRVLLKTASMAYSVLRANFADQTFQGAKIGLENQRRFISRNVDYLRQQVGKYDPSLPIPSVADCNFAAKTTTRAPLNRYIVSEGSLPAPAVNIASSRLFVGGSFGDVDVLSYADVCNKLGLPAGSQLTILLVVGQSADGTMQQVYRQRLILAPSSGDMSVPLIDDGGNINLPNEKNITTMLGAWSADTDGLSASVAALGPDTLQAAAVVASYNDGSGWQYSTSQLYYPGTGYLSLSAAVESFRTQSTSGSSEYTQQAEFEPRALQSGDFRVWAFASADAFEQGIIASVVDGVYQVGPRPVFQFGRQKVDAPDLPASMDVRVYQSGGDSDIYHTVPLEAGFNDIVVLDSSIPSAEWNVEFPFETIAINVEA